MAVVCQGREYTYDQFARRVRKLVGALRGLGFQPGDRVGVVGPNSERYLELYFAVPCAGLVLVPVNWRLSNPEMLAVFENAGIRALFRDGDFPRPEGAEHLFDLPDEYEQFLESGTESALGEGVAEDDLAALFYTSGTTGVGKGAMHTHRGLLSSGMNFAATWPFRRDTRWLVCSPMFHTGGTLAITATVWAGGTNVILPVFHPDHALDHIEQYKITHTLMVPTMLAAAVRAQHERARDVSSMKYVSHGASPISIETLRATHAAFPGAEMLHVYGTTETTPITTLLPNEDQLLDTDLVRSCGQPAVGVEVRVVDTITEEDVPKGSSGEIWVRSQSVMKGYWRKPEETAEVFSADGWYRTGDLGYLDEAAHVFLVDRAKDMIVTGGENVYSIEVEAAVSSHPAVGEVAVFGVPDERWGEAVYAVVYALKPVTEEELIAHCKERIAGYKVPKQIEIRSKDLPKSAAGKLLKRELRDPHWANQGSQVSGS
ncbi:MAG: AMP-binding protein [Austwickia sp.]|nr:AMP-binding protein [Austwickia sp.]MBK8435146.1 AMP-binding protein [Austwickia sp.]MBK9101300.1 AMP-binding protein [Austwickia sp.]